MLEKFETFVKKNKLFSRKSKLLLALSGGEDSICLFHLLRENGYSFSAAHCNFKLRGKESDGDESFVKKLCEKHHITLHTIQFDTTKYSHELGLNTQETARFLRYRWFDELAQKHAYKLVLTAHHMEDNAETMIINLNRGTGISGLHGIPLLNNSVCRPLLTFQKEEITEYLAANSYQFRVDSSNKKDDYLRNKIRHHVIPALKQIDPNSIKSFYESAKKIHEFELMSRWLISNQWHSLVKQSGDDIWISYANINTIDSAFLPAFLYENLRQFDFSRDQTNALCRTKSIQTGFRVESKDFEIIAERSGFLLRKKQVQSPLSIEIAHAHGDFKLDGYRYEISVINKKEVDYSQLNCLYFDKKLIDFPLNLRPWKAGDKIKPLGMKGSKKISDWLTDKKVPNSQRKRQFVLVNAHDELLAILPDTISDVYKVRHESIDVLRIKRI